MTCLVCSINCLTNYSHHHIIACHKDYCEAYGRHFLSFNTVRIVWWKRFQSVTKSLQMKSSSEKSVPLSYFCLRFTLSFPFFFSLLPYLFRNAHRLSLPFLIFLPFFHSFFDDDDQINDDEDDSEASNAYNS